MIWHVGVGVLGLTPAALEDMTPGEVYAAYRVRLAYDHALYSRPTLQAGRLAGWMALLPHSKKNSRDGPADVYPFPWEQAATAPAEITLSPEEAEAHFARFDHP